MIAVEQVDFVDIPTRDAPTELRAGKVTLAISDPDGNSLMLHRRYAPRGQH